MAIRITRAQWQALGASVRERQARLRAAVARETGVAWTDGRVNSGGRNKGRRKSKPTNPLD